MRQNDGRHGRAAGTPRELRGGWKDVAKRVRVEAKKDNLPVISAGVAFYVFLAIVPALAGLVSLYGLIADPADVQRQLTAVSGMLPEEARRILEVQLNRLVSGSSQTLGISTIISFALTLWSATKGTKGMILALNIAYDQEERRGTIKRNALALALTLVGMVGGVIVILLVAAAPAILDRVGLGTVGQVVISVLRWPFLAALMLFALAILYRYAPAREKPRWSWVTPGSLLAVGLWLLLSFAFSFYVSQFGNFNETYGSLAAVVVLLLWLYLSAYLILLGAEFNAEAERQTVKDTTKGPPRPPGERGAYVADTTA